LIALVQTTRLTGGYDSSLTAFDLSPDSFSL
ncbi:hypothetical protein SMU86_07565, partial [Streptococcus mutans U2A]